MWATQIFKSYLYFGWDIQGFFTETSLDAVDDEIDVKVSMNERRVSITVVADIIA